MGYDIVSDARQLHILKLAMERERNAYLEIQKNRTLLNSPVLDCIRVDCSHSSLDNMDKWLSLIDREISQSERLTNLLSELYSVNERILSSIRLIERRNYVLAEILTQRYLNRRTQAETADLIGYTLRHTQRLEDEAVSLYNKI